MMIRAHRHFVCVLLVAACAGGSDRVDDSLGVLSGGPGPSSATPGDSDASTTSSTESTTAAEEVASTDTGGVELDTDATGESTTDGSSGPPPSGICAPIPTDAMCTACSKTSCCAQLEACSIDEGCSCYMTCVAQSVDVFGCGLSCGVDLFAPGPVGDLVACSAGPCGAACT